MFAGFAYTERVPVRAATVLYEVGNTWMIAFLYLLLVKTTWFPRHRKM